MSIYDIIILYIIYFIFGASCVDYVSIQFEKHPHAYTVTGIVSSDDTAVVLVLTQGECVRELKIYPGKMHLKKDYEMYESIKSTGKTKKEMYNDGIPIFLSFGKVRHLNLPNYPELKTITNDMPAAILVHVHTAELHFERKEAFAKCLEMFSNGSGLPTQKTSTTKQSTK